MLSWLMSEPRRTAEGQVKPSSPQTQIPQPKDLEDSEEVEVIDIDVDDSPADPHLGEPSVSESPVPERSEEEETASPKLRRSKRKASVNHLPYIAKKRAARSRTMSACRRTPPVNGSATASSKTKPPALVLGANTTSEPTNFPFPPTNVPHIPVVSATAGGRPRR